MVNYPQSWRSRSLSEVRSRSVPARSIAYPFRSATYRLPFQKCDRLHSRKCDRLPFQKCDRLHSRKCDRLPFQKCDRLLSGKCDRLESQKCDRLESQKCDRTPDYTGKMPDYKRSQRDRRTLLKETVMVQFKANK
ncbi:hypothetical protein [Arthrospira sp. PCC 8006]|uniref:hypothetical protein n=1 Tax=Arthrospira sp. PCC 8006 TaxID=1982224 RepID=UPI00396F4757